MRGIVAITVLVALALGWLWHEVATPASVEPVPLASAKAGAGHSAPARPSLASPVVAPAGDAPAAPPGGIRAWSPTAAPVGGPDPFAPVVQIRTAEDTRAGLTD